MSSLSLRKLLFSVGLWLTIVPGMVVAADGEAFFDSSLGDFSAELKTARQEGKLGVLLVFEAEGCPYCRRMREQVLNQLSVQQFYRRHFNIFAVDILGSVSVTDFAGKELAEKAFARAQRVRGTPTFLFVAAADGREMARYTGATRDVDEFLALGRYVAEGHHSKMTFDQYYPNGRPARRAP